MWQPCGVRSLANKALQMGYFWPTMRKDAVYYATKYKACQIHAGVTYQTSEPLHPTLVPWPFMKWGMDIIGKLPPAMGQKVFFLAMSDYFSKWGEVETFREVKDKDVVSFMKRNIICKIWNPV